MTNSTENYLKNRKHPSYIDDSRVQYYLDEEIKNNPNEKQAIINQKKFLQVLSVLSAIASVSTLHFDNDIEKQTTFFSLLALAGVASLRAKRQNEEKKIAFFSSATEKFVANEVLNSEPKTLNFVSNSNFNERLKSIHNHTRNVHKIQLLTCTAGSALLTGFCLGELSLPITLISGGLVLASSNFTGFLNARNTLKKISQTLPKAVILSSLSEDKVKVKE